MTTDDLPPLPAGVVPVPGHDPEVFAHWRRTYSGAVDRAGGGAPTALLATLRQARAEVEYARLHGVEPQRRIS